MVICVILTPFPFYKNIIFFSRLILFLYIKVVLYLPNFSLMFLIHVFLYAGVYCTWVPININLVGHIFTYYNSHPDSTKTSTVTPIFYCIFVMLITYSYELEQVLENCKYSFFFSGITLNIYLTCSFILENN